jgi:Mg2+/Co2+ transporter CorB
MLLAVLAVLIALSAFFSGSETAMMALNRYRLRHLAEQKHKGAQRASALLERPDRLIGVILIGNNFVNILASSIATVIGLELFGEAGIAVAAGLLTLILLIFAEVAPKTVGALYPEKVAFPSTWILGPLLMLMYPLVWTVNVLANGVLRMFGIRPSDTREMALSREELRTVVQEAGALIPRKHQTMLFGILDLEKATVEDIMEPRNEIVGLDLEDDLDSVSERLSHCRHTRLPVYRGGLEHMLGILHVRQIPRLYGPEGKLVPELLEKALAEPYYIPMGTPLHTQLTNFQREKLRMGLVVDEYGDIQGLVTLEDILEEIVGEFTTAPQDFSRDIHPEPNGSYLVDGGAAIREINRAMHWRLPKRGAKTLNGLILELLESIPDPGTSLQINGYTIEIVQTTGQSVKTARIRPPRERKEQEPN